MSRDEVLRRRINSRVVRRGDCLLWTGANNGRYGHLQFDNEFMYVHRAVWLLEFGPIPEGKNVLHKCDETLCVAPSHLFLGTQAENLQDMRNKNRQKKRWHKKYDSSNRS